MRKRQKQLSKLYVDHPKFGNKTIPSGLKDSKLRLYALGYIHNVEKINKSRPAG
jgi:hypothetical protein